MSETPRALDLFEEEGKDDVKTRMAEAIRKGLDKRIKEIKSKLNHKIEVSDKKIIEAIAKKLGVKVDTLTQIFDGKSNGEVNYDLFDRLEFPLDLSIHKVLGKPTGLDNPDIQKKWYDEFHTHPMLLPAAGATQSGIEHSDIAQKKELALYVTLRAVSELRECNK